MHMKRSDQVHADPTIPVTFILQDPQSLTGKDNREIHLKAAQGESLLEVALDHGINIEHACGGGLCLLDVSCLHQPGDGRLM